MDTHPRITAGVPAGGQFTAVPHAETAIRLEKGEAAPGRAGLGVTPDTPLAELDRLIGDARRAGDERAVRKLSMQAVGRIIRDSGAYPADSPVISVDLRRGLHGLNPMCLRDAFDGHIDIDDADYEPMAAYVANLHGDDLLTSGALSPAPINSRASYRLNVDKAMGTEIW